VAFVIIVLAILVALEAFFLFLIAYGIEHYIWPIAILGAAGALVVALVAAGIRPISGSEDEEDIL
jgi:hypothetical protein